MKVTVSGAIVSKNGVTLFIANGESMVLSQDSYRTDAILDAVMPGIAKMQKVEIDLDSFSLHKQIEAASKGKITVKEKADGELVIRNDKGVVIDNASALKSHVELAAVSGNTEGLKNFMMRFEKVQKKRQHSASELLDFMKHGDLPIANDGSIIAYKILKTKGYNGSFKEDGYLRDPHTGLVRQKVGSLVYMPASKVDDDRRNLCSVGLHVCSRQYLKDFYSRRDNILTFIKIRPDDVISVPIGESSKMRVCAYHICKLLSKEASDAIYDGKSPHDIPEAARALAEVVTGDHPPVLERVEVKEMGNHEITPVAVRETRVLRKAKKPILRVVRKDIDPVKVKEKMRALKQGKLTPAQQREKEYQKKLAKAQKDFDKGMSIREIAKKYRMDRESLSKNLDRSRRAA